MQMRTVFLDSLPIRSVRETYERECEWTVFITTGVRERKKKGKEGERERERDERWNKRNIIGGGGKVVENWRV